MEIPHEHPQSELRGDFRIPGHQLIAVVIEIEIEWVLRVHIDQDHVGVRHRELAEGQLSSMICHVVSSDRASGFCLGFVAKDLNDLIALNPNCRNTSFDMRWWKDLFGIEDQVIFLAADSADLFCINEIGNLKSEQIHQALES